MFLSNYIYVGCQFHHHQWIITPFWTIYQNKCCCFQVQSMQSVQSGDAGDEWPGRAAWSDCWEPTDRCNPGGHHTGQRHEGGEEEGQYSHLARCRRIDPGHHSQLCRTHQLLAFLEVSKVIG